MNSYLDAAAGDRQPLHPRRRGASLQDGQAYGFVSETANKATMDFASGLGENEATMSRIALALEQIQAKGKLAGGEMLQLTETA